MGAEEERLVPADRGGKGVVKRVGESKMARRWMGETWGREERGWMWTRERSAKHENTTCAARAMAL